MSSTPSSKTSKPSIAPRSTKVAQPAPSAGLASTGASSIPVEVPTETKTVSAPVEAKSAPVEAKSAPVEAKSAPVETKTGFTHSLEAMFLHQVEIFSQKFFQNKGE